MSDVYVQVLLSIKDNILVQKYMPATTTAKTMYKVLLPVVGDIYTQDLITCCR